MDTQAILEGADRTEPEEGCWPTAGQVWYKLLSSHWPARKQMLDSMLRANMRALQCVQAHGNGVIDDASRYHVLREKLMIVTMRSRLRSKQGGWDAYYQLLEEVESLLNMGQEVTRDTDENSSREDSAADQ